MTDLNLQILNGFLRSTLEKMTTKLKPRHLNISTINPAMDLEISMCISSIREGYEATFRIEYSNLIPKDEIETTLYYLKSKLPPCERREILSASRIIVLGRSIFIRCMFDCKDSKSFIETFKLFRGACTRLVKDTHHALCIKALKGK
jgi:hypothetical protein